MKALASSVVLEEIPSEHDKKAPGELTSMQNAIGKRTRIDDLTLNGSKRATIDVSNILRAEEARLKWPQSAQ